MNCNEIRELISSMLDHQLNAEDSAVVTEHLAECPECMRVFEAFHAISVSLEELEDVPDGFTEAVMHKINTPAPVKKRRPAYLRLAGLAACLALVIFTGSQFVTSHLHSGDRNIQDTAQYTRVAHQTPKPTPTPTPASTADIAVVAADENGSDGIVATPDLGDSSPQASPAVTATPLIPLTGETVVITPTPVPTATPGPTPTPVPNAVRPHTLASLNDLLVVGEQAAFDLYTENADYTLTVQDKDGRNIVLLVWMAEQRIYCKDPVNETAWFAVGTTEQFMNLMGIDPPVTPTVSPTVSPAN